MQRRGADFRVSINGVFYAVARIGVSARVGDLITSNTEGTPGNPAAVAFLGCTTRIADLPDGEFTLQSATWDDADNPWAAPISLALGGYYALVGYPAGIAAGVGYTWGNCLLVDFDHSANVPGPQPMNLRFRPDGVPVLSMLGAGIDVAVGGGEF